MRNQIKSGEVMTVPSAPATLTSGEGTLVGSLFVIASTAVASGAEFEGAVVGVFELPKVAAQQWNQGNPIYWDAGAKKATTVASGNTLIGCAEQGAANPTSTGRVRLNGGYYPALDEAVLRTVDVTISATELKALNATPKEIVAAPGAGKAVVPVGALLFLDYGTATYDGIAAGEDLAFKYTNAAGATILTVETTGFLDATADAVRWAPAPTTALITPVANAAVVANMLVGEIATGDSPLKVRFFYRVVPTTL